MSRDQSRKGVNDDGQFYRIRRLPPYIFESVNQLKAEARQSGRDIIDLGMGNPDLPPAPHVIEKLIEVATKPGVHRYSASRGITGLRRACAAYYERRFGVKLDMDSEIVATIGSKEGFANMAQAITAPGDVVLVPNPAYPIHTFGFILAEAAIRHIPLESGTGYEEAFLRAVDYEARHSSPAPLALIVNFPCNPTAQTATPEFYRDLVALARRHEFFILSDLAYAEIYFEDPPPSSLLAIPGAKEIAVEFSSMSKTHSMPGWRVGFAVGNERLIHALRRVKSYVDYGAYTPIQAAAAAALNGPQDYAESVREEYRVRRDTLVESMGRAGWDIPPPAATMFAWAPLPPALAEMGSLEFSKYLLEGAELAVAPGIGFGEHGEGFVRISLVENVQRIRQAARNFRKFIDNLPAASSRASSA